MHKQKRKSADGPGDRTSKNIRSGGPLPACSKRPQCIHHTHHSTPSRLASCDVTPSNYAVCARDFPLPHCIVQNLYRCAARMHCNSTAHHHRICIGPHCNLCCLRPAIHSHLPCRVQAQCSDVRHIPSTHAVLVLQKLDGGWKY